MVDRSRGEKLIVDMDIVFPRVPCYRESRGIEDFVGTVKGNRVDGRKVVRERKRSNTDHI